MALASGDRLGAYQIVAPLGAGGGATRPMWNRNGKELFFLSGDSRVISVEVKTGARFEHSVPKALYEARLSPTTELDVAPDGQRLLISRVTGSDSNPSINLILNWNAGVKQ